MSRAAINPETNLTKNEKLFADTYLYYMFKVKNPIQVAGIHAYKDTDAVRRVYCYRVIYKDRVRKYISMQLDKAGLTDEVIFKYLRMIVDKGLKAKGSTKDAIDALEIVLKLHGLL